MQRGRPRPRSRRYRVPLSGSTVPAGAPLVTAAYRSIAIDTCSRCQGIWLDAGALERILAEEHWLLGALKRILT